MIVQGGKTLLAQKGNQGQSLKSDRESKDFQDLLLGAKKKTTEPKQAKSTYGKEKEKEEEAYDSTQKVALRSEEPVKKKDEEQSQPTKIQQTNSEKIEKVVQKIESKSNQDKPVQDTSMQKLDKKFAEVSEVKAQPADSLNLSGVDKNTLGKNQINLEAQENAFENMMAQMKMQAISKKQLAGLGQGLTNKVGVMKAADGGSIKLGSELDFSQAGETLSLNEGDSLNSLKTLGQEGGEANSEQPTANLESLFNQYLEQDISVSGDEGVTFADSLNQVGSEKSEKIENMQSVIKQARAFVDDGGGSMEIHLQPEGLGKVHLKVAVQDGQVNVEMLADNMAAKKALEEGLIDIKNALEGQKLLVETLKVEMSPDYQKDFSDLANHMQEQANRDFAEQFLGQFRQEREEKFGGLVNSFRNFQPGPTEPELTLSRNPYTESGKGRSINLVA